MSYPNMANSVNVSSGQLLFGDPSKSWSPYNFPNFPSTNLSITTAGRVEDATFSTLTFPNVITYEPCETPSIQPVLEKTMVVAQNGNVSYVTPKVSCVSSFNAAFSAPISSFTGSTIGGVNIQDVTTGDADSITNALGKLDSWITNAFLLQPPCITPVQLVSSSLYAGVRWNNFRSFNILNASAPYTTAIVLIIGDPTTNDYITLELTDPALFPLKNYRDGISPVLSPLVRLRIFTDFFPKVGKKQYTKQTLQNNCITIINESGACVLPQRGKVVAMEYTDGISTYTTFNIYIPSLKNAYPKDTEIPIRISYINKTEPEPNVCVTNATIRSTGPPSAPITSISTTTQKCITYVITPPIYSDALNLVQDSFSSTYTISYTWNKFNSVQVGSSNVAYMYGTPSPSILPDFLSTYQSTYTTDIPYYASTLVTNQMGTRDDPFIPGSVFQTSVFATNNADLDGPPSNTVYPSTLNISSTKTLTLSSITIVPNGPNVLSANSLKTLGKDTNGWYVSTFAIQNVFFLSTPTNIPLAAAQTVQFNDASLPGDRTPIIVSVLHTDTDGTTRKIDQLLSTINNDYLLNDTYGFQNLNDDIMYVTLSDTSTKPGYSHMYYNAYIEGQPIVTTMSTGIQKVQFELQNTVLTPSNTLQAQSTYSAQYTFNTEPLKGFTYDEAGYTSTCTDVQHVSGLPTASGSSKFLWNAKATDLATYYAPPSFANAYMVYRTCPVGPITQNISSITVLSNATPITTTPWPSSVSLQLSSLAVGLSNTMYQDPVDPQPVYIRTTLQKAYPPVQETADINLTSNLYIDALSVDKNTLFNDPTSRYGLHIQSLIPRLDIPTSSNNIGDGVSCYGITSNGLDTQFSSFINITSTSTTYSDDLLYNNMSTLLAPYPDNYSRELMMLQGTWLHPADYNFSTFNAALYNQMSFTYPDFTYDGSYDSNQGFRYATFLYTQTPLSTPTVYTNMLVTINNTNFVGSIGTDINYNTFFPDAPVSAGYLQFAKVKLHVKNFAAFDAPYCPTIETAWINGIKQLGNMFDDTTYDNGACVSVSTIVTNSISTVIYNLAITPRYYTNIATLVRLGIASARDEDSGESLEFESVNIQFI